MSRLADPQNLLLNFRHSIEAAFDREVAARDHHAHRMLPDRRKEEIWQALECLPGLNLEDDSEMVSAEFVKPRLKLMNVSTNYEFQIFRILKI